MKLKLLLFLLISIAFELKAQDSYFFKNFTSENGLTDNNVRCVVRDDEGFLWIGTESGLSRFDGTRFVNFKSWQADSSTISSNSIYDVFVDSRKRLWVAALGMNIYQRQTGKFRRVPAINYAGKHDFTVEVFSVFEDNKNRVLICTPYIGLQVYDEQTGVFNRFIKNAKNSRGEEASLPYSVTSVIQDSDGIYWMVNYTHLYRYDEVKGVLDEFPSVLGSISGTRFQSLKLFQHTMRKDLLLVSTWGDGLVEFDKTRKDFNSRLFEPETPKNLRNIVMSVYHHNSKYAWAGTNNGIQLYDKEKGRFAGNISDNFSKESLINSTMVNCIYNDPEGIIWIGTPLGLSSIHPQKQSFVGNRIANYNRSFFKRSEFDGLIYATEYYNERSLVVINPQTGKSEKFKLPNADLNRAEPFHIAIAADTNVWIGSTRGLYRFDGKKNQISKVDIITVDGKPVDDPRITDMLIDRNSNLWISCRGFILKKNPFKNHFNKIDSVATDSETIILNDIELITGDDDNRVFLYSTSNDIILLNDDGTFKSRKRLVNPNGIRVSQVTGLEPGFGNSLWLTTRTNGLIHLSDNGKLKVYRHDFTGNQLSDLVSLTTDKKQNPWFVSGDKIYTLDTERNKVVFFSSEDGLPFITRYTNLERFPDGSIAFNISKGLFTFKPEYLKRTPRSYEISLYGVYINGKMLKADTSFDQITTINLKYDENNIVLDYVARNHHSPASTVYSYQLEGSHPEWSAPSPVGLLSFNQLNPGTYLLKVKAGSPDIPDQAPHSLLKIVIQPAWYQTLLFKISVSLLIIIMLIFITRFFVSIRYKEQLLAMNHSKEIEQIRARISRDIHDEIGAGLTKIKLMTRKYLKPGSLTLKPEDAGKITDTADELIRNMGEIVWTINPENDSLKNIVAYIRLYLSRLSDEQTGCVITFDLPAPENVPDKNVNPQLKRNVLLVLKEAINNSIKHAQCTMLNVKLLAAEDKILFIVKDNGRGFNEQAYLSTGNGLKNMKKRAEEIGGHLAVNSDNDGTTIEFQVVINNNSNLL